MIDFIFEYKVTLMCFLNLIVWYYFYKNSNMHGLNKKAIEYFLYFFTILFFWDVMMIMGDRSGKIYLFFWTLISIYELYFFVTILFNLADWEYKWFAIIIPSLPIIFGSIFSYQLLSYQPVNTIDFVNSLILLLGSIIILWYLLIKKDFLKNIESFFIFSGFVLYFIFHVLSSNIMFFDFLRHWNFANLSLLIVHYFWIGSILCTQRIRSKYSS